MKAVAARIVYTLYILLASVGVFAQGTQAEVLFICEHGSAKSVVAATYFAKLASKEGLNVHVVSRGTNPDAEIPEKINQFLIGDGFDKPAFKPQKLSPVDLQNASYVVIFTSLPPGFEKPNEIETWTIPSFETGYPIARDSIVSNIERLIFKIKSDSKK